MQFINIHILAINTSKFVIKEIDSSKVVGEPLLEFWGMKAITTVIITTGWWTATFCYKMSDL